MLTVSLSVTACRDAEIPEGAFVVLLDVHPKGLDPRFPGGDSSAKIMGLLHAGLVSIDTPTGAPELELAVSIEQRDETTYEVALHADAVFHDGAPVTSADVEYTFMELSSKLVRSPMAGIARRIERFEVHDDRRFTIKLKAPHAPFLSELSMGIVPKHLCAGKAQCPMPPIGAGPFTFRAQHGDHTVILG
ncbi:MAG: ABC transporter substrate-binding protein, partial [Myxococcota bacterium]